MKPKRLPALFAALALAAALSGCTPAKPVTTGSFDGTAYANDYFGLTFRIPDGWSIATKDQMEEVFQVGAEMLGSDDKDAESKMELAKQKTLYLTYAMKYPYGYTDGYNDNVNVMCENLNLAASLLIKTGADYIRAMEDQINGSDMASSGIAYTFGEITSCEINGTKFDTVDGTMDLSGFIIHQRMYCTLKNHYAILFAVSWMDDGSLEELQSIMDTVEFK
jgi:hypothetical protein